MSGLVSIIMPVYNGEKFIRSALGSILSQSYSSLEVIVVDDGSIDGTAAVVCDICRHDVRVKYVWQAKSGRPACARNTGISRAVGEYICFLDADDLYEVDKIKSCVAVLDHQPDCNVVFHDVRYMDEGGTLSPGSYLRNVEFTSRLLGRKIDSHKETVTLCDNHSLFYFMCMNVTTILPSSVMLRRDALFQEQIWFPETLVVGEDADLWFRIICKHKIIYLDQVLSLYRQYPDSITKSNIARFLDSVSSHAINYKRSHCILSKRERSRYRKKISLSFFDAGFDLYCHGYVFKAIGLYFRSFYWHPTTKSLSAIVKTVVKSVARRPYIKQHQVK